MENFITSQNVQVNPTSHVQQFLEVVDRVSGVLGLNVPQIIDLEKLRSLPSGAFGLAWADFLDKHQLQPLTTGPRRKQLHDGIHVLTGYGTDRVGEAQVQAFLLGAKSTPINLLLLIGILQPIYWQLLAETDEPCYFRWDNLWQAYQRGRYSLFDPDAWEPELLWELPLEQVQALFRV